MAIVMEQPLPNLTEVEVGPLRLWFSYRTIIAFQTGVTGLVVSENQWSKTTGKHLNHINPDKKTRFKAALFNKWLEEIVGSIGTALVWWDFPDWQPPTPEAITAAIERLQKVKKELE